MCVRHVSDTTRLHDRSVRVTLMKREKVDQYMNPRHIQIPLIQYQDELSENGHLSVSLLVNVSHFVGNCLSVVK